MTYKPLPDNNFVKSINTFIENNEKDNIEYYIKKRLSLYSLENISLLIKYAPALI